MPNVISPRGLTPLSALAMRRARRAVPLAQLACALSLSGCSMTKLAVGTQAQVMRDASPAIEELSDWEFARLALPGNLLQTEALLRITPEDPHLLLLSAWGFASYSYGFVEDEMERAEQKGDLDEADRQRARARAMYLKARDFGIRLLELEASDVRAQLARDPDVLSRYLTKHFDDAEHAPALFWTGYAWGSAIGVSRDDPALIADLALAEALVKRSVELDEKYYSCAGHVFLGVVHSSRGQSIGGDPETGRKHFERALAITGRKAHLAHVNYAQYYAVQAQNRKLFEALLQEVVQAPVPERSPLSLPNTIAHRRAERLLAQAERLILEPLPAEPAPPAEPVLAEPASAPAAAPVPAAPGPTLGPAAPTRPAGKSP